MKKLLLSKFMSQNQIENVAKCNNPLCFEENKKNYDGDEQNYERPMNLKSQIYQIKKDKIIY